MQIAKLLLVCTIVDIDWHILSGGEVKAIASHAPMTVDELKAIGILSEKKLEEYGARIVKPIKMYVKKEGLEEQVARKLPATKSLNGKVSRTDANQIIEIVDDDDDEFANGIDYDAIDLG